MVVRMRIYESQNVDHAAADRVFYERVKPVHERYGAKFMGRYRDPENRVVVLWRYSSLIELKRIQEAVSKDPSSLKHKAERLKSGLHACDFKESFLFPTDQEQ